jgi:hypothetical protein
MAAPEGSCGAGMRGGRWWRETAVFLLYCRMAGSLVGDFRGSTTALMGR